jgi:hypothetical protein
MDRDGLDDCNFPDTDPINSDNDAEDISAAETHYNNNGNDMKTIVAMAMGLKKEDEETTMLVNTTKDPWLTKVPKKTWRLGLVDMKEEILCWVGNQVMFLPGGKSSYLLIFWDLSDSHQLQSLCSNKLMPFIVR